MSQSSPAYPVGTTFVLNQTEPYGFVSVEEVVSTYVDEDGTRQYRLACYDAAGEKFRTIGVDEKDIRENSGSLQQFSSVQAALDAAMN
jgi:hypothetical protein